MHRDRARPGVAPHVRPADAGRDVQVPPELLAVRARRVPRATASSAGAVFAGWRILRCNPWSHGGVDHGPRTPLFRRAGEAEHPRDPRMLAPARVLEPAQAARGPPAATSSIWFHDTVGLTLGVVDRRAHRDRADPARAGHGEADPLDAEPAGARAGDEGDPAEVEARQAAPERGADEVLPGEQDQPGGLVPADGRSRSRSSSRSSTCCGTSRRTCCRDYSGSASTGSTSSTSPSRSRTAGARCCSSSTSPASYPRRTSCRRRCRGAQRILLMVLPVALRPVHPQLPGRPDALLADDEPLDDGQGLVTRRLMPKPELPEKRSSRTPAKDEPPPNRRPATSSGSKRAPRPPARRPAKPVAGPPRRVKRKRAAEGRAR